MYLKMPYMVSMKRCVMQRVGSSFGPILIMMIIFMIFVDVFKKATEHFESLWIKRLYFSVKWVKGFSYCVLCVVAQQNKG